MLGIKLKKRHICLTYYIVTEAKNLTNIFIDVNLNLYNFNQI